MVGRDVGTRTLRVAGLGQMEGGSTLTSSMYSDNLTH